MYKLIIVDDEEEIRRGLRFFIEASKQEYEIAGEFDDGNEAIEFLNENYVELVITDVKMNSVSGIDVMKFIYEAKLPTKVIVISGYKKFDYSTAAIEYKARFYMSKPTDYDDLVNAFRIITEEIKAEKEEKAQNELIRKQFLYFKNEFLKKIFQNNLTEDEFKKKLEIVGASDNFKSCRFAIVSMRIASYEEYYAENITINGDFADEKIINAVLSFFKDYSLDACCVHSIRGKFKFAVYSDIYATAAELMDFLDTKLKELEAYMTKKLNVEPKSHISAGYSDAVSFFKNDPVEQPAFENDSLDDDDYRLVQIERYISTNITKDITLQQVAEHFHYNMNYFSGYFKQRMGENFSSYIINMKMNIAKNLLCFTNKKLSEISSDIGYSELSYFLKVFKKNVGVSPMEYRKKYGKE